MAMFTQLLLMFLGVLLMIIVLLQRGRGGGLAGAFGGMGGQSAFGTKAGDVFTKITVVIAIAWVLVAGGSGYFLRAGAESRSSGLPETIDTPGEEGSLGAGAASDESDPFSPLAPEGEGDASETPATDASADADGEDAPAETPDESADSSNEESTPETPATDGDDTDESAE